ncbi:MAG: glycoside hydrolase family 3 protein [Candidatus Wildermuthbacteria bacterium]|nr:glycoside hydrolase family 3 protein [Candidatus Wildermuthbacteria bacterium]
MPRLFFSIAVRALLYIGPLLFFVLLSRPFLPADTAILVPVVSLDARGEENIARTLSLEEQVGQLLILGFEGKTMSPELSLAIKKFKPGGVLLLTRNIESREQVELLVADLQAISPIPLFVAVDQEGGVVSRLWWQDDTAPVEFQNPEHAYAVGKQRARALKELGITMNLSPVLDGNRDIDFIYPRSFQRDSNSAALLAVEYMRGHEEEGVLAVAKHFPGYDGIAFNPEGGVMPKKATVPDISLFRRVFLDMSPRVLMVSHVIYEELGGVPFPFSQEGISFLRREFGEDTLVMSDDLLSRSMVAVYPVSEIGVFAVDAGADFLLAAGYPDTNTMAAFVGGVTKKAGEDEQFRSRVLSSASKILRLKETYLLSAF